MATKTSKKNPAEKPLVFAGSTTDSQQLHEGDEFAWEHFTPAWVPGYDEHVKANEIARNPRLTRGQKEKLLQDLGAAPKELSARVAWVRARGADGGRSYNASIDQASWRRKGYRPATVEDLAQHQLVLPPTAHVDTDGTIRRVDCDLWIVDESKARAFDRMHAQMNADFHSLKAAETQDGEVPYIDVLEEERRNAIDLTSLQE